MTSAKEGLSILTRFAAGRMAAGFLLLRALSPLSSLSVSLTWFFPLSPRTNVWGWFSHSPVSLAGGKAVGTSEYGPGYHVTAFKAALT